MKLKEYQDRALKEEKGFLEQLVVWRIHLEECRVEFCRLPFEIYETVKSKEARS